MKALISLIFNRNYVLYWFASMFSVFGAIILQFIISLYVFDITGDSVLFGSLLFIAIVPRLILYPLAGMWADKFDRRAQMIISVIFVTLMLLGFTSFEFFFAALGVPALFILVMLLEVFDIVFMSANMSIPPMIVPDEHLGAANSAGILYSDFGYLVGVIFGALLYGALGFLNSLLVICLCFVASLMFIIPLRLRQPEVAEKSAKVADGCAVAKVKVTQMHVATNTEAYAKAADGQATKKPSPEVEQLKLPDEFDDENLKSGPAGFFRELTQGARYVLSDRLLMVLFTISIVFNFFMIPIWDVVLLFFVRGDLGLDSVGYGVYTGVQAIGDFFIAFVIAIIYSDSRGLRFVRLYPVVVLVGLVVMLAAGLIVAFSSLASVLIISALGSAFVAMAATAFVVCKNTIVQKRVPEHYLSRVFSINRMTALVAFPFGNLLFGFFVAQWGYIGSLLISMVGISLLLVVTLQLRTSDLRAK